MARLARSARGQKVDFDVIAIKQQLASKPIPVGVSSRRKFIDEKDGIKRRENFIIPPAPVAAPTELPSALMVAAEAAQVSAEASSKKKHKAE